MYMIWNFLISQEFEMIIHNFTWIFGSAPLWICWSCASLSVWISMTWSIWFVLCVGKRISYFYNHTFFSLGRGPAGIWNLAPFLVRKDNIQARQKIWVIIRGDLDCSLDFWGDLQLGGPMLAEALGLRPQVVKL